MEIFLTLVSGICWTIVYLESIRLGFKEKTYAIPLFALALNIAWEGVHSYQGIVHVGLNHPQVIINAIWFLFDLVIVYTLIKFGKKELVKYTGEKFYLLILLFVFLMSFIIQHSFFYEFGSLGAWYSAFLQNLLMSILFINMLVHRKSSKGQSMIIALSKWIGTLAPTILFGIVFNNQLVLVLGVFCSIFDIIYIVMLRKIMLK